MPRPMTILAVERQPGQQVSPIREQNKPLFRQTPPLSISSFDDVRAHASASWSV